jgi:gamma-glutamyl-gamma-aminobutyrate hydrolase PuuD
MKPIIGITGRPQCVPAAAIQIKAYLAGHTYTDSIRHGGGIPVILVPVDADEIDDVLDRVDGLLFTGGGDISPAAYGAEPEESVRGINIERDTFEFELVRRARERKMPVMGICRGMQVINVALGGTLIQDLPSHTGVHDHDVAGEGVYEPHLQAEVAVGTRLSTVVGAGLHSINSIHHQAVDELGEGLSVVASAIDGTVEAIDHADTEWPFIAVQWHPEFLAMRDDGTSHELFAALVGDAAKYRADA